MSGAGCVELKSLTVSGVSARVSDGTPVATLGKT
jgi:hypothetical protein